MVLEKIYLMLERGELNQARFIIEEMEDSSFNYVVLMLLYHRTRMDYERGIEFWETKKHLLSTFSPNQVLVLEILYLRLNQGYNLLDFLQVKVMVSKYYDKLSKATFSNAAIKQLLEYDLLDFRAKVAMLSGNLNEGLNELIYARQYFHEHFGTYYEVIYHNMTGYNLGVLYHMLGDYDKLANVIEEMEEFLSDNPVPLTRNWVMILQALLYESEGKFSEALNSAKEIERCVQKHNLSPTILGISYLIFGDILHKTGNHFGAVDHLKKAMEVFESVSDFWNLAVVYSEIGRLQLEQGNLNDSLENLQKSLSHFVKIGNDFQTALVMKDLAMVQYWMNAESNVPMYIDSALNIARSVGNADTLSDLLYHRIIYSNEEGISSYLEELSTLSLRSPLNKNIQARYVLAEAHVLKSSLRIVSKFQSLRLYFRVIQMEGIQISLLLSAYINLFELLLLEYKVSTKESEGEVLADIAEITNKLEQTLDKTGSLITHVKLLVLKSKYLLLQQRVDEAQKILARAAQLSNELQLTVLANQIQEEVKSIDMHVTRWMQIIQKNRENIEELRKQKILDYLQEASKIAELF